jgi:orotidine-5'-phosphate decarboxylase
VIPVEDRLIVALDVPTREAALELDGRLGEEVRWVKVGLELFTAAGPDVVRALGDRGRRVFLDLKLHDIPHTVAGAVRAALALGVDLLTLHAEGGPEMMHAAREARDEAGAPARLIAVTLLTSLRGAEYPEVYRSTNPTDRVVAFARAARDAGLDGVVSSPLELSRLATDFPPEFLKVTPGIRPAGNAPGDQARIATPGAALRAGATHLVIGRPITAAPDPGAAVRRLLDALRMEAAES